MSESSTHHSLRFEEIKLTQERIQTPLPMAPLVTFDLNLNNLQDFLNKVSTIVNKNTLHIHSLTEEISQRVSIPEGLELLESITFAIPSDVGGKKIKSVTWKEGVSAAHSSLEGLSTTVQEQEKFKKRTIENLKEIREKIDSKLSNDRFDREKEELDKKIAEKISKDAFNKKISAFEDKIRQIEDQFACKINEMEKKVSDVKTETLWKINDCEKLLKIRVNEQFVWDALATLETKLRKDLDNQAALKLSKQQSLFEKMQADLKKFEEEVLAKLAENKKLIGEMEKEVPRKLDEEKFSMFVHQITTKKKSPKKKFEKLENRVKGVESLCEELKSKISNETLEDMSKLFAQIEYFRSELDKKAERDAVIDMFNTLKAARAPVVQSAPQEFTELWKFRERALENFRKIDEKFEKLSKAMDLSIIKRAIAGKADEGSTKEEFLSVGQRLIDLERGQSEIWKEIEKITLMIKKMLQSIDELGNNSGLALISKKSLAQCLSCGRGDSTYIPTVPHVQGFDGRFYKADLNTFRPAVSASDWKTPEENENEHWSPVTANKGQKIGINAVLGKDLVKSLSTSGIGVGKFRPASAKK